MKASGRWWALLAALALCCRQQTKPPDVAQLLSDLASSDADKSGGRFLTVKG